MLSRQKWSNWILLPLLCCWSFGSIKGQNIQKQDLITVLKELENKYDVRFSYAADELEELSIGFEEVSTLEEALDQLVQKLPVQFNKIDERYISIVRDVSEYVCGRLLAADTGQPLSGANIVSTLTSYGTISNPDGTFYIPKYIGQEAVVVRYIGYQPWEIPVSSLSESCEPFLIPTEVSTLETVFVTNYLVEGIEKKLNGSIQLNTSEFGLLPGQVENDILFVTQALPGIQSVNETVSNINVRGGTHDENLILWNDIKSYQSGHFFGLISAFNPDITQDVTIYKNGTPSNYGDGISSEIAMYSKDNLSDEFSGGAGINLINGSAFGTVPVSDKATLQFSGRLSLNGLWESPVYRTYSEKVFQDTEITNTNTAEAGLDIVAEEEFSFYDFSTRVLWDVNDRDKFRVNFLAMNNTLEFTETVASLSNSKTSELNLRSLLGGVSWERQWNETFKTKVLGYVTTYYLRALNLDLLTTQEVFQENDVLETGVKAEAQKLLTNNLSLQGGYQFVETGITNEQEVNLPRFLDFEKDVLRTHSAFAGITYKSDNERTNITAGVRANYFDKFQKTVVEPRLSLHQGLGSGFAVEAQGEFKSQATTQRIDFDSDFLGVEKRRWILADEENIPVITSMQGSVGLVFDQNGWFVNAEGFYKMVEGITSRNQGFQNQFQFSNASGNYSAYGGEFVINRRERDYSFWISYSYLNNEYEFETFDPSIFPHNLDVTHTATVAGSYSPIQNLKVAAGLNYRTGKPYTIPSEDNETTFDGLTEIIQFDIPNAERLPDYYRLDVSGEYLWQLSDGLEAKINVAVLNVLDTRNTLNIRYTLSDDGSGNTSVNEVVTSSIGLSPNFSFQLLF